MNDNDVSSMSESDGTLNDATPGVDVVEEMVSPSEVDDTVEKEKLSHVVTTTKSYPPLPTQVTTSAGNAPGNSSYANVTSKPSWKKLNFRTLFTPRVWVKLHGVPVTAFSEDGLSSIATKLGTLLMLDSYTAHMCMQSCGWSSYAKAMIELRADVELNDNIVAVMPKITREGYYTCNICVEYEWKPPRCACCKVFGHVLEECPKNISAGATKNLKKTSQTPKGILVGQKIGFKPKQVFQPVSKKSTANTCGKKKNNSESTKEVSKSNPFEVLTLVDNDVELGTNGGISNSADKGTINVSSNDDGNPLVPTCIMDCDSEVEVVFDETTNLRLSKNGKDGSDKVYGTNSLLEQWRDSYPDNDDYDPYDDDMYENHDMSEHLQSICDDLDITVYGRKKKYIF
ncbi:hypothetical protein Tco_0997616 [Tanacetum coccineum]